jgi:hypothetical protein
MKPALKSRKRKLSSNKRAPVRSDKRSTLASSVAAITVGTKGAEAAERGDTAVLYRVYDRGEKPNPVLTIDATGPTFGDDLRRAFEKNVAKARRENKKKFGSPDPHPSRR